MVEGSAKVYDDIYYLTSLNIGVVPLCKENGNIRDVKSGCNTKTDYKPTLLINKDLYNPYKLKNAINNNIIGFYLQTGKRSNITILDIDNKPTTNPDIIEKIKALDTLTISTPSGGFHYVCKYTSKYTNNSVGIYNNIDVRTNNQITFFGIRADGIYSIIDKSKEIKELTDDIINELKKYRKPININDNDNNIIDIDVNDLLNTVDIKRGYNITEKELYEILKDLPNHYYNDYDFWLEFSYIMKKNGNWAKVWDRLSKRSPKYDKKKNINIYNSLDVSKEFRDLNYFISILNKTDKYKNNKLNNIQKIYKKYTPISTENERKITDLLTDKDLINGKFLNPDIYKDNKDCVVWSGLGSGKSKSVKDYIYKTGSKVLTITLLSKTTNELYQSFNKDGIPSIYYKDLDPEDLKDKACKAYENRLNNNDFYDKSNEEQQYNKALNEINENINKSSIFITIDSILKLIQYNIKFNEYVIFIDEIHSLLKYLLTCENLKDRRKRLFSYFMNILKSSKQVILSDGDICNNSIKLLEVLNRGSFKFVKNPYKINDGIRCYREHNFLRLIEKMKDDIKDNIYFTVACNTKETANKIKLILKEHIQDPNDLLIYTADEGERIIDINKEWLNKYIIYSPSIVCGLDFNPPFKYNTYSIIEGDNTLNPEEIGQQIARNRNIKELCIYINKTTNILKYNNINDLKNAIDKGINAYKEAFKDLIDTETSEDGAKIDYKDNIFTELLLELEHQNDIIKSSYYYNLFEILKNKGFKVERNLFKSVTLEKAEQNKIKEELKQTKEDLLTSYINDDLDKNNIYKNHLDRLLKSLDIPEDNKEDLKKFNNILIEDKAINKHINIRLLTTKTEILRLLNKQDYNNDYIDVLYKDKKPLTLILRDILNDYLKNDIDLFDYKYNHNDLFLNDTIDINDYHYQYIKSVIRTKKPKPQTKGDLLDLLNSVIKSLFGRDMIKTKKINKKQNDKVITVYDYSFNQDLFKSHLDLYKLSLNNNKKYKYINVIDNIKDKYYNDIVITDKDDEDFKEYLTDIKNDIEKEYKKNIKEHIQIEKVLKKQVKKDNTKKPKNKATK